MEVSYAQHNHAFTTDRVTMLTTGEEGRNYDSEKGTDNFIIDTTED